MIVSGGVLSPKTPVSYSEPVSLTESMQLVDEILCDVQMDRMEKIQKLEEILSAATSDIPQTTTATTGTSYNNINYTCHCDDMTTTCDSVNKCDVACQTLSTGDIVITKIWFTEEEKEREKTLMSSPKKC
jgi:exonuclease 3'-5' domain-containing protein 1